MKIRNYFLAFVCNILLPFSPYLQALPPNIEVQIRNLVRNNPQQLSVVEYALIAATLSHKTPCNMLVFGMGRDSSLWITINEQGTTIFLEDNQEWFDRISQENPQINAYLVTYNTQRRQWQELLNRNDEAKLLLDLPDVIKEVKWDLIFVDAPEGWSDEKPGRMKSIFTAAKLAHDSKNCHVFVHDCNRNVEAVYCDKFLCADNLISTQDRLRHYYIK